MRPPILVIATCVLLASCQERYTDWPGAYRVVRSPTAPSGGPTEPPPTAPAPTPPAAQLPALIQTLSGVVSVSGVPLPGARVTVLRPYGQLSAVTTTDGNGFYHIPDVDVTPAPTTEPVLVGASRPGFFTEFRYVCVRPSGYCSGPIVEHPIDFELVRWTEIPVGEEVEGDIGDADCAHWGYGWSRCQRFAITAPSAGTLVIGVMALSGSFDYDVVKPDDTFAGYSVVPGPVLMDPRFPAVAGSTYQLRMAARTGARFLVRTRMQ